MKKILVTGASGFIGRTTLQLLLQQKYEVHAVYYNKTIQNNRNVHWHRTNLINLLDIKHLLELVKPTYLIHLAWDVNPKYYRESATNLTWVQASIEIIKQFNNYGGKRVVFAGTCFEYDLDYGYLKESLTPKKPEFLYGVSKSNLKDIIELYCKNNEISFAWGRIFYLYGPNESKERVIPYIINQLLQGEVVNLSHGNQIRDFLYVNDVGRAFVDILNSDIEGVVNIGSGSPVTLKQIFINIGKKMGREDLLSFGTIKPNEKEPKMIVADNTRLLKETLWKQYYDLEKGINLTINWWRNNRKDYLK